MARFNSYSISLKICLCVAVNEMGNLIFTSMTKLSRSLGVLLFGMPKFGNRSSHVGGVGPPWLTGTGWPSCRDYPRPACQGLFQVDFNCTVNVVSMALEEEMWFL
jgi:hypothetical protein